MEPDAHGSEARPETCESGDEPSGEGSEKDDELGHEVDWRSQVTRKQAELSEFRVGAYAGIRGGRQ